MLLSLLFVIPSALSVQRPSSRKQARSTASSAVSPIQHPHRPGRPFIHIVVSPSASVYVVCVLLGSSVVRAGLFPTWFLLFGSWSVFLSVSSFPSWFLCSCGAFPHRGFCYLVLGPCPCQFRAFLVGFCVHAGLFPTGVLLLSSLLVQSEGLCLSPF